MMTMLDAAEVVAIVQDWMFPEIAAPEERPTIYCACP